jgi:hypothetical protein
MVFLLTRHFIAFFASAKTQQRRLLARFLYSKIRSLIDKIHFYDFISPLATLIMI